MNNLLQISRYQYISQKLADLFHLGEGDVLESPSFKKKKKKKKKDKFHCKFLSSWFLLGDFILTPWG